MALDAALRLPLATPFPLAADPAPAADPEAALPDLADPAAALLAADPEAADLADPALALPLGDPGATDLLAEPDATDPDFPDSASLSRNTSRPILPASPPTATLARASANS